MEVLIDNYVSLSRKIEEIKNKHYHYRKGSKQNFNLFSAIVSGKHSREHIEMYHSNILAYLLNPNGSHDCDDLFLKKFVENIKTYTSEKKEVDFSKIVFPVLSTFVVERERKTNDGRYIDICFESNYFIFFIENKIRSGELDNQVYDYRNFVVESGKPGFGIFLTKFGQDAESVAVQNEKFPIISLSYRFIIRWLEGCCKEIELIYTPHILSSIVQYINSLKKILGIMSNPEKVEINELIFKNKDYISAIEKLLVVWENADEFYYSILERLKDNVAKKMADEYQLKLEIDIPVYRYRLGEAETGFYFFKSNWKYYCIAFYFTEKLDKIFYGICNIGGDTPYDDKLKNLNLPEEFRRVGDWRATEFGEFNSMANWADVLEVVPQAIERRVNELVNYVDEFEKLHAHESQS